MPDSFQIWESMKLSKILNLIGFCAMFLAVVMALLEKIMGSGTVSTVIWVISIILFSLRFLREDSRCSSSEEGWSILPAHSTLLRMKQSWQQLSQDMSNKWKLWMSVKKSPQIWNTALVLLVGKYTIEEKESIMVLNSTKISLRSQRWTPNIMNGVKKLWKKPCSLQHTLISIMTRTEVLMLLMLTLSIWSTVCVSTLKMTIKEDSLFVWWRKY